MARYSKAEQEEARAMLRDHLRPGVTVYTILRHRSASGMLRVIDLLTQEKDGPRWLGYNAARAMGDTYDDARDGIRVGGCGMDMGFALVYNLGRTLWPDGFRCSGKGCQSNDHSNGPHYRPDGRMKHRDGGYALRHRWL
jgi:hypothetical protein